MLKDNPTPKELKIKRRLEHNNLGFIFQQPLKINNKPIIVDFFHPIKKIIIEIDGNAHTNLLKDIYRDYWLLQQRYLVLRYNNDQKIKLIIEDIKNNIHSNSVRKESINKLNRFFKFIFGRYFFQSNSKFIKIDIVKSKIIPTTGWFGKRNSFCKYRKVYVRDNTGYKNRYIECKFRKQNYSIFISIKHGLKPKERKTQIRKYYKTYKLPIDTLSDIYNLSERRIYELVQDLHPKHKCLLKLDGKTPKYYHSKT